MTLAEQTKQKAIDIGFDLVGITDASPIPPDQVNHLIGWLDAGHAGQMTWMRRNLDKRINPGKLLPGAQSVIVVGLNYKPRTDDREPFDFAQGRQKTEDGKWRTGRVAGFAHYEDYHPFIKKQLRKLADFLVETIGPGLNFKICVDSAPLLERALAIRAGLGFIGRNHALINPRLGPQILLGEILTNLELESSDGCGCDARLVKRHTFNATETSRATVGQNTQPAVSAESCNDCSKCISACPTGALRPDGTFDATKCISYLTIESEAEISPELAPKIGNHLFGCSDCILACPYQHKAPPCANKEFAFYRDRAELNLNELLHLTEGQFQNKFHDSPILRAGLIHLKRVARICLKNTCACPEQA